MHADTPANHPPEAVFTDPGAEVCASCHTTTYDEWQHSAHGEQQLACTTCHQPHPQTLRFETANALCLNCHEEDARDDYAHLVHPEQQCIDCHWFRPDPADLQEHFVSGNLIPTGHTGTVETQACVSCHEDLTESDVMQVQATTLDEMNLTNSSQPLHQAQVRIQELEAEVTTVKAQGENNSALRMVQGLIIGVVVGGIFIGGVARFRHRRTTIVKDKPEDHPSHDDE